MLTSVDCRRYSHRRSILLVHRVALNDVRDVLLDVRHLGESEKNPQHIRDAIRRTFKVSSPLN